MDDRRKERRLFDTALINPTSSHLILAYFEKKPFISICKKPEKIRHYFRRVQRIHLSGFEFNFNDFSQSISLLYQLTMEKGNFAPSQLMYVAIYQLCRERNLVMGIV